MKGAKTSEGIRIAQTYSRYMPVMFVNPVVNFRVSNGTVETRSGMEWTCTSVITLVDLECNPEFQEAKLIVLDEAQFYPDLLDHVTKWCDKKSYVVIGLDGDSDQKKFGQIWDLIPFADRLDKVFALCEVCKDGTPAVCTKSTIRKDSQIQVDAKDGTSYLAVCRKHRN